MIQLVQANAKRIPLPDGVVSLCCTSPPYFSLRDYNVIGQIGLEKTPEEYIANLVEVFREVRRCLAPDGLAFVNLGDSYASGEIGRHDATKTRMVDGKPTESKFGERKTTRLKTGIPAKNLVLIPQRAALAFQADGWWVRSFMPWPKCISGGAYVYARTQKGDSPMMVKDLVRLKPETVKLWDGKRWAQAIAWEKAKPVQERKRKNDRNKSARFEGRPEVKTDTPIEIELRNGERIGCTHDHRWPTDRGLLRASDLRVGDIIKTTTLPEPEEPRQPHHIPDSMGWFIGMYLAEGSRDSNNSIQISSHINETDRLERLRLIASAYGGTCQYYNTHGKAMTVKIHSKVLNGIIDTYLNGRVAKDKCLSSRCWQRSNAFLYELLSGYLEGDGHYDYDNNRWRLGFTRNYNLAMNLRTICARLGVRLRLKLSTSKNQTGKRFKTFAGEIRYTGGVARTDTRNGEIMRIGKSRARQFWDIAVEGEPHLFSLASGVLTHNSNALPESVRDRPTTSHEYWIMLAKSKRYFWDGEAVRLPNAPSTQKRAHIPRKLSGKDNLRLRLIRAGRESEAGDVGEIFNESYANPAGRNRRTADTWLDGLDVMIEQQTRRLAELDEMTNKAAEYLSHLMDIQDGTGMLTGQDGEAMALRFNTASFSGAHFATFPAKMIVPLVKAGSSERGVCPVCRLAWRRVVETTQHEPSEIFTAVSKNYDKSATLRNDGDWCDVKRSILLSASRERTTTGWTPSCTCTTATGETPEPIPALVLDPFCGTGTTLEVARALNRDGVGLDLSLPYLAEQASKRLGLTALAEWEHGIDGGDELTVADLLGGGS